MELARLSGSQALHQEGGAVWWLQTGAPGPAVCTEPPRSQEVILLTFLYWVEGHSEFHGLEKGC